MLSKLDMALQRTHLAAWVLEVGRADAGVPQRLHQAAGRGGRQLQCRSADRVAGPPIAPVDDGNQVDRVPSQRVMREPLQIHRPPPISANNAARFAASRSRRSLLRAAPSMKDRKSVV